MKRSAGILCPIFSLPSPYGIGTLGQAARDFIDFLEQTKQSYWQILPIGPTSYGDSPYQSFSSYAGNPYFIDLDTLKDQGLLLQEEYDSLDWGNDPQRIEYAKLFNHRFEVLKKAVARLDDPAFDVFCQAEAAWLDDYALFMTIKDLHDGKSFLTWPAQLRNREPQALEQIQKEHASAIRTWKGIQYFFFQQYATMKAYANLHHVQIIGDIPIYVAMDSVDVWSHPEQFLLNETGKPDFVAGCPPDAFSEDGQLWGNPLFDWERMKKDGYQWWIDRIAHQMRFVDVLRIDHFRGFAGYYAIPAKDQTARNGHWEKGPGIGLFDAIHDVLGNLNIIAEDLGFLTPDVYELVQQVGYPGMKILQFAFDDRDTGNGYYPHSYTRHCVVYPGTHDNDTVLGWMHSASPENVQQAIDYLHLDEKEGYNWGMIRGCFGSVADWAIIPMADILGLDNQGRINVPSTLGNNWVWRFEEKELNESIIKKLKKMTNLYGRNRKWKEESHVDSEFKTY